MDLFIFLIIKYYSTVSIRNFLKISKPHSLAKGAKITTFLMTPAIAFGAVHDRRFVVIFNSAQQTVIQFQILFNFTKLFRLVILRMINPIPLHFIVDAIVKFLQFSDFVVGAVQENLKRVLPFVPLTVNF